MPRPVLRSRKNLIASGYRRTSVQVTVGDPRPAHRAQGVHGVLAAEAAEARLAECVAARNGDEGVVQNVQAHRTDEGLVNVVQLRLGIDDLQANESCKQ